MVRDLHDVYLDHRSTSMDTEFVFTDIFRKNKWGGEGSVSGTGSDFDQTRVILKALPGVFKAYNVTSVLDIPCGDFHWMQKVDLGQVHYTGADIVKDLIDRNNDRFQTYRRRFLQLNLVDDALPKADLVFCRDCLVHLCFRDVLNALDNICESGSKYLLTTTYINRDRNHNIKTGQWRALNLERPPFNLPKPVTLVDEKCLGRDGYQRDKSLGLWLTEDIKATLTSGSNDWHHAD